MSELGFPAKDDRRFWVYYAHRVQALVEMAEKQGTPLWERSHVPKAAAEYAARAVGKLRVCMCGTPWLRKRALSREAKRFQKREGWRGEIPALADCFEYALHALAIKQVKGSAGSPLRKLGATKIPERRYVNKALEELTVLAFSKDRPDWAAELLKPGSANRPSQGRTLIARYACKLAQRDGVALSPKNVAVQIRERAKTPPTHVNAFALYAHRLARKSKPRTQRLIKAVGM